jgi:hypothetical protein
MTADDRWKSIGGLLVLVGLVVSLVRFLDWDTDSWFVVVGFMVMIGSVVVDGIRASAEWKR